MELLSRDEVNCIIKQVGFTNALKWSINNFSDGIIGYLGEHLKLTVEVESDNSKKELQFFVKCVPRLDAYKAEYLKETMFFIKEFVMLNSLFKYFNTASLKWRPDILLVKEEVFVFEDVTQHGYKMSSNRDVFTFEQVQASVETIARFHAMCYIYEEKKSTQLGRPYRVWEDYKEYLQEPVQGQKWRNAGRNAVIEFIKIYSKYRHDTNFITRVDAAITQLYEEALSTMKPHPVYRNVVVHRDLWTNNILFKKYDDGKYHALIVDFQTVLYSSPMMDLSSFMYFNTTRKFREHYLKHVLDLYFKVLNKELEISHVNIRKVFDRETLEKCYDESVVFGMSQAALILPITAMDAEMREKLFGNPDTLLQVSEVTRSSELIEVAKTDHKYLERVNELMEEIAEQYICPNVSMMIQ